MVPAAAQARRGSMFVRGRWDSVTQSGAVAALLTEITEAGAERRVRSGWPATRSSPAMAGAEDRSRLCSIDAIPISELLVCSRADGARSRMAIPRGKKVCRFFHEQQSPRLRAGARGAPRGRGGGTCRYEHRPPSFGPFSFVDWLREGARRASGPGMARLRRHQPGPRPPPGRGRVIERTTRHAHGRRLSTSRRVDRERERLACEHASRLITSLLGAGQRHFGRPTRHARRR